ncbi:MAG: ATP-binding protein [Bilophila wadsworthia]
MSASEDRVAGSLDMEAAFREGVRVLQPGLLAAAHRGILYIDEVNLLPDHVADVILEACSEGVNRIRREGISAEHPSRFVLVGTMNPEEGELRPQLLDRFGLAVSDPRPAAWKNGWRCGSASGLTLIRKFSFNTRKGGRACRPHPGGAAARRTSPYPRLLLKRMASLPLKRIAPGRVSWPWADGPRIRGTGRKAGCSKKTCWW